MPAGSRARPIASRMRFLLDGIVRPRDAPRRAQAAILSTASATATRQAPCRSPRPSTMLRRARRAEPTISVRIRNARNRSGMRCPIDGDSGGASRDAFVHGPTVCTNTRRPPKAPASSRSGVAPSSGRVPVHAARVSVATSGVHSGVAGVKRSRGQRTASKTICQSIGAGRRARRRLPRRALRRHGVELEERAARVHQRRRHADQPERRIGQARLPILGFRGISARGLVRYQKPIAGTRPDGSAAQRLAGGCVRAQAR